VDVIFDEDLAVTEPWDRFRFDIDLVRPLGRDGAAFLGDLTDDGVSDLVLATFSAELLFFPGMAGQPFVFGDGTWLREEETNPTFDPYKFFGGDWETGDIADLD